MSDTGGTSVVNDAANEGADARAKQLTEDLQRAKDAGWNNPIPFVYETVSGGEADAPAHPENAPWLSDAAVYEWQDDYGTVAPRNEELERQLFEDPDMQRAGNMIQALEFEVKVEGKEKVYPVRNVSQDSRTLGPHVHTHTQFSSTRPAFIQLCWKTSSSVNTRSLLPSSRTAFPQY
jgi:hypothetical protein